MNGYGIIRELAERSGGTWRPSSGAVYPALALLEDEQLIGPAEDAGPKHYQLTDAGRAALADVHGHLTAGLAAALADWSDDDLLAAARTLQRLNESFEQRGR